jgi:type IV pilus assembly protein PilB
MKGKGCRTCSGSGYKGRVALYEVMPMTDGLKEGVLQGLSTMELKREAIRLGMQSLRMAGISKLMEGITTVDEVARCSAPD